MHSTWPSGQAELELSWFDANLSSPGDIHPVQVHVHKWWTEQGSAYPLALDEFRTPSEPSLRHLATSPSGPGVPRWMPQAEPAEMFRKIERPQFIDVLDRILDKGIVIDASIRLSLAGIDFLTVEARVVVGSIETYLHHGQALSVAQSQSAPVDHCNWPPGKLLRK